MLDSARWMGAEIVNQAIANGDLKIEELDDKIRRILRIVERSDAFEHPHLANDLSRADRPLFLSLGKP